jgi:hypothetical protein
MTLNQLVVLKQWHLAHRQERPVEFHAWEAVLTLWLFGWLAAPAALLLWRLPGLVLCIALMLAPRAYVELRRDLHRRRRLRCDWLYAVRR